MRSLHVRGVTAAHGETPVLRGVDLDVPAGSTTAVLGASGCGKTTLLRVVAGFMHLGDGEVRLDDEVIASPRVHLPPERRGIGYVRQDGGLFPHLDVGHNVAFGWDRSRRRRRDGVGELLELVGLDPSLARRRPHELSGGQQQRVALARALALDPAIILLDEPFAALDTALRASTREAVAAALAERGATTVLVTHDQGEALSFADQVAIMRDGLFTRVGSPREVYERPSGPGEAAFLGESIGVQGGLEADGTVTCAFGRVRVRGEGGPPGTAVDVVVRPEQVLLVAPPEGAPAEVVSVRYFGHDALVDLRLDGGEAALSRVPGTRTPQEGERVGLVVTGDVPVYPRG